ncbi:hypothetical protein K1719_047397 [Acacia pycnantha]|nr:hypothetical protein K1719_047397 [Acacia pycnantha]
MGNSRADAGARGVPRHAVTARAASHDRGDDVSAGISTARAWAAAAIRVGPRPESIGGPALTVPHPTGAHRQLAEGPKAGGTTRARPASRAFAQTTVDRGGRHVGPPFRPAGRRGSREAIIRHAGGSGVSGAA